MEILNWISELNKSWDSIKLSLSKKDRNRILGRDSFDGKRVDCFHLRYWKRPKLLPKGKIIFGYVFKSAEYRKESPLFFSTWVIHSEDPYFQENPYEFLHVLEKSQERYPNLKKILHSKVEKMLYGEEADFVYVRIDPSLADGRAVYLSCVTLFRGNVSNFHLGLNLFVSNSSISKDLIYLPRQYWTKEFEQAYPLPLVDREEK